LSEKESEVSDFGQNLEILDSGIALPAHFAAGMPLHNRQQ
jgi:hypothetical protein